MVKTERGVGVNIDKTIDDIYAQLRRAFKLYREYPRMKNSLDRWNPIGTYEDFKEDVIAVIDDGISADELDIGKRIHWLTRHGDYYLIPLLMSTAYCIESQRALAGKDRKKALYLVKKASEFTEWASEGPRKDKEKRQKTARKGGLERARHYDLIKKEVKKFLNSPPVGGWRGELEARQAIRSHLKVFKNRRRTMAHSKVVLTIGDHVMATLRRWFKHDDAIRTAYKANSIESYTECERSSSHSK